MHLVVFEDSLLTDLAPLTFSRPAFLLRCGAITLLERMLHAIRPQRLTIWCRDVFAPLIAHEIAPSLGVPVSINTPLDDAPALLASARWAVFDLPRELPEPHVARDAFGGVVHALIRAPGLTASDALTRSDRFEVAMAGSPLAVAGSHVGHAWDLLDLGQKLIASDAMRIGSALPAVDSDRVRVVGDRSAIRIADGATVQPGVVLDASAGPIVIESGASVGSNSVIEGPCFIGRGSTILPLTLVRAHTILGPVCKVGGEIGSTTLLGYSNKQHHGFIGDSYLGEWVNLGAGTVTGNLKNTLGEVRVQIGARSLKTGRQFLGAIIGDHARSATGTLLPTGCYIGYACHVSGPIRPPRFCRSGTMLTDEGPPVPLDRAKAQQIAIAVMERRHQVFQPHHRAIMDHAFELAEQTEALPL